MWFFELLYDLRGLLCSIFSILISYYLIFGFRGILWQSFLSLLTKEPKDLCFSEDKNIALSVQYTASSDIL